MRLATIFSAGFCLMAVYGGQVGVAQTTGPAPNCCGLAPVHDYSQKSMVGTAVNSAVSSVYFTGYRGDVSGIYYPTVDTLATANMEFLVGDAAKTFLDEEKNQSWTVTRPDLRSMRWQAVTSNPGHNPALAPVGVTRRYRPGTLVLETEFKAESGRAVILDFMPPADGAELVRIVVGQSGRVDFRTEFVARFDYGSTVPWISRLYDGAISAVAGPERLVLRSSVALSGEDLKSVGDFTVEEGQSAAFVLSYGASYHSPPSAIDPFESLEHTETFWRAWSDRCPDVGPWTEAVKRSLITLKALTYAPTGGIVAAATTSLPEQLGGVRNWDYRYCWLRDATFTILALMKLGYYEEARAWRDWLLRAIAGSPHQVQIMYGVGGERWLPELTLPWLKGYADSSPVRIGNAACDQMQIDVFGEIADAAFQTYKAGMAPAERGRAVRPLILEYLTEAWRQPDEGI